MTSRRDRIGRALREVVLTVGAVLGVIAIIVAIGAVAFGLRPLVFRSGSMEPAIGTGDLALAHRVDAADLRTGQIVSVIAGNGDRITHRITRVQHENTGYALLNLRGDANKVDDAETYHVKSADKVLFSVPKLGYVVAWLSGSTGRFLLGLYAAFLIMVILRRGTPTGDRGEPVETAPTASAKHRDEAGLSRVGVSVAVAAGLLLVPLVGVANTTWASWVDPATLTGTTFTTYDLPTPILSNCTAIATSGNNKPQHVTVQYTAVTGPPTVTYTASVTGLSGATATTTGTSPKTVTIDYTGGGSNKNTTATITVMATLSGHPLWTESDSVSFSLSGQGQPTCV